VDYAVPELNPHLDRVQLAQTFARAGRVHITSALTDASARRVHNALERETPWGLILNEGKKVSELETVSAEDYQAMAVAAWGRANSGFQYFYHYYRLFENGKTYPKSDHYLAKLVAFLTAPDFLAFIREVTRLDSIACISSTATLYKPLDFLTIHDDGLAGGKLVAYVLNVTPKWRPDWGGALQFFDRDDHIEEGYLPTFNTLNLFRVPKRHSVSQVAAFGGLRYSVSGWFGAERPDQASAAAP
jgi:Rps23 Pro-64 3,4-dihydroxylase Tpa1-like proline 4-hydroxylase